MTPRWEIWPTAYVYKFGLSGPLAIDSTRQRSRRVRAAGGPPASPPPGAGQLIDVGAADLLMVLGLNTPSESRILDARLWQFPSAGPPVRRALRELPPPWPVDTFHVYGLLSPGDADPYVVAGWTPGVYRLDLLVDPGAEIRRIGLLVRRCRGRSGPDRPDDAGAGHRGRDARPRRAADAQREPARLRQPRRHMASDGSAAIAALWAHGAVACRERSAERAVLAIATSDVSLVGVDLGPDRPIERLAIERVDPVAAPIDVVDRTELVDGASGGRIVRTTDGRPLRGRAPTGWSQRWPTASEMGWYFRVLPANGG